MKTIDLVRHGESEGNAAKVSQGVDGHLSPHGLTQVRALAKRLSGLDYDGVVCSTMPRAIATLEYLAPSIVCEGEVTYSDLFAERRPPSENIGKGDDHPHKKRWLHFLRTEFKDFEARFADEENSGDLYRRAVEALEFLKRLPGERILVITHGYFSRALVAAAVLDPGLTGRELDAFCRCFRTNNTGINTLEYSEDEDCWYVRGWNDHAHL